MFDLDNWQEIWVTITRNKLRSFLTGFGVFWGIFMLMMLLGAGESLEGGMKREFDGFASNSCFFFTGNTSEGYKGYRKGRFWRMNNKDVDLIRQKSKAVEYISPVLFGRQLPQNVVRGRKSGTFGNRGIHSEHFKIEQMYMLSGRLLNKMDVDESRKVCVIGIDIYEALFAPGESALGQYIRLNGIYFQVVGVIRPKSKASLGGNVEATAFIPFSTMQRAFNQGDVIHFLACTAKPGYSAETVENQVKDIIKEAHNISPTDQKALRSFNMEKEFKTFEYLFFGINVLIWIVGLGALLSGIIGISNIMMVTVRERTREIGVKRALGAKPFTIVLQVLSESFILTAIAGIIGFSVAVGVLEVVRDLMGTSDTSYSESSSAVLLLTPPFVSFGTAIIAFLVLVVSGVLAGLLPATRALSIKAIDAIREE